MFLILYCASLSVRRSAHFFFFFNDTATTEIYTLSLHDALPIYWDSTNVTFVTRSFSKCGDWFEHVTFAPIDLFSTRSEEHTSELQSPAHLVCLLLLRPMTFAASAR